MPQTSSVGADGARPFATYPSSRSGVRRITPAGAQVEASTPTYSAEARSRITRSRLGSSAKLAVQALALSTSDAMVLDKLVSCYGIAIAAGPIVWPSNDELASLTRLSLRTVQRSLARLVNAGVIVPRDSATRKRFAIRAAGGEIVNAFGFNLSPLITREAEFIASVSALEEERQRVGALHDRITIARIAIREVLEQMAEHHPGHDTRDLSRRLLDLIARAPRRSRTAPPIDVVEGLERLWIDAREAFMQAADIASESTELTPSGCHNGALVESNSDAYCSSKRSDADAPHSRRHVASGQGASEKAWGPAEHTASGLSPGHVDVHLIITACPEIREWVPAAIVDVPQLIEAGRVIRSAIQASPSAWSAAVEAVGPLNAALAAIYVAQRYADGTSGLSTPVARPGGYYREIVRRIAAHSIDLRAEFARMWRLRQH